MHFAIVGAGVVGLVYASRLAAAGHDVTLVGRPGERFDTLDGCGVVLHNLTTEMREHFPVCMKTGVPDETDWIIASVPTFDLGEVLTSLLATDGPPILTLANAPFGLEESEQMHDRRLLAGFPQITGYFDADGELAYVDMPGQVTRLALYRGDHRVAGLANALSGAGFTVRFEPRMNDWLKAHAVFTCGVGGAMLQAGSCEELAHNDAAMRDMVSAVGEGFALLRTLGVEISSYRLGALFSRAPEWISVPFWRNKVVKPDFTLGMEPHVMKAREEMADMARSVRRLLMQAGRPMTHLSATLDHLEARTTPRLKARAA